MDAQSTYSIYVHKETHSVQSEMWNTAHCSKLSKTYSAKKTIISLVVKSRNYYREGIRYIIKVYYKVYLNIFESSLPMDQKW